MIHSMALRLVAELRSGYHKQAYKVLHQRDTDGKCCLGVACWMVYQNNREERITPGSFIPVYSYSDKTTKLDKITQERFGFYHIMGRPRDEHALKINGKLYNSLAQANDDGCTFAQIADYIEANWESL